MEKPEVEISTITHPEMADSSSESSREPSIAAFSSVDGENDTWSNRLFMYEHLDRLLERRHITGIAFSGTVGIGLFITSGELIAISGSLGCVLSFVGAGAIVISVMRCLAEMVSVRPLFNALIDYPHTFVDKALGFAVGVTYWLAQCVSMATLTSAAARVANNLVPNNPLSDGQLAGIITGFSVLTILSNMCGVKWYGRIERVVKWIKLLILISLCVLMIVVNIGNVGYSTQNPARNYTETPLVPFFKPTHFLTTGFNGTNAADFGIPGAGGRFLAVWTSITLAVFACMGGDIVIVTAGEAKNPRVDLPAAARFMYLAPIGFYILGSFLVGFNINYADPDLFHPLSGILSGYESHSPFIIALKHSILAPNVVPTLFSALFMFSAYTASNTGLFAASRTLFALSKTYGNHFFRRTIGRTNAGHTPIAAIFCCSVFLLFSFLGLADTSFNQPIFSMSSFFTGSISCVYAAECIAYLRFKKGLSLLADDRLLSRDSDTYREKFYRAHWQPTFAWFGLCGCIAIMLTTGWPAIYVICARAGLVEGSQLKPNRLLAWDLIGTYAGPTFFFFLYAGYKILNNTRVRDLRDTSVRDAYELRKDRKDWEDTVVEPQTGWKHNLREVWSFIK